MIVVDRFFVDVDYFFVWVDWTISPYSVRIRENADQKNPEYGHFLRK